MTLAAPPQPLLPRVRAYLREHRRATLGDLAIHFRVAPDAMLGMLDLWIAKGRVRILDVRASCNTSCSKGCDDEAMAIVEWVDPGAIDVRDTARPSFTALPLANTARATSASAGACRHEAP